MSPEDFRAMLAHAAENFTAEVEHQPEVYLREPEIEQILLALASPLKGKVVVVGPSRVGKTAVAQAAVRRIAQGRCPPPRIPATPTRTATCGCSSAATAFAIAGPWRG